MDDISHANAPAIADLVPAADPQPPVPAHVMIDTETIALGDQPAFLSIGAVKFTAGEIVDRFHVGIDPKSCQNYGLDVDASTVMWWFDKERDAARAEIMALERIDLVSALLGFAQWLDSPLSVWSNGAGADLVWLRNAYKKTGLELPWSYKAESCYRTKKNETSLVPPLSVGTAHTALADAEYQARHLQAIWREQDQAPLRAMLEKCAAQFSFYGQSHRDKMEVATTELDRCEIPTRANDLRNIVKATERKALINESFASDIRQLLDGGPVQA
jgi:hypothetical protein